MSNSAAPCEQRTSWIIECGGVFIREVLPRTSARKTPLKANGGEIKYHGRTAPPSIAFSDQMAPKKTQTQGGESPGYPRYSRKDDQTASQGRQIETEQGGEVY